MDTATVVPLLSGLMQANYDAIIAGEAARHALTEEPVQRTLSAFRRDHQRYLSDLTALVRVLGGKPPALERSGGKRIPGWEALLRARSTGEALEALQQSEQELSRRYDDVITHSISYFPPDAQVLLEIHYRSEQQHLVTLAGLLGPAVVAATRK